MDEVMAVQLEKIEEAARVFRSKCAAIPKLATVLGSGLNTVWEQLESKTVFSFSEIPHLRVPTVEGHSGQFIVGNLGKNRVCFVQGRLHYYEGWPLSDVVFPMRMLAVVGVPNFLLTNAAGGLAPGLKPSDLVLLKDHINLMGGNPLVGKNEPKLGPRFPDLTHLYDPQWRKRILEIAADLRIPLHEGVYVATQGPSYETPAEIRMFSLIGGDVVGMSTVPEAIALHHMGKKVAVISCVTNLAAGVTHAALGHEEVIKNAAKAHDSLRRLIWGIAEDL